ncbi:hypothetical protein [Erysipelothrix anatis]|uniref:hypothetical protein n=1 Tax=Erysipelothrix anatis TaxID=2683713 RepID=UPI001358A232|nr:hypothetical protein [Erysipelothrix anatis]
MDISIDSITITISIISLIFSVYFATTSARRQRFNLKVEQLHGGDQSGTLLSYDGVSASVSEMTGKPHYSQVALIRIVLTNRSASPISILSFFLGDEDGPEFSDYSHTEPFFVISTGENTRVNFGFVDNHIDYLKPVINLSAYESTSGYLLFPISEVYNFDYSKRIKLVVKTSRKTISKNINFGPIYQSHDKAKYEHVDSIKYNS